MSRHLSCRSWDKLSKEQTWVSSGVSINFVGIIVLRERGVTANTVAFMLALLVMKSEATSHKIVPRSFLYYLWPNSSLH